MKRLLTKIWSAFLSTLPTFFDDVNDICWAWEKMYTNVLNGHAPIKSKRCKNAAGKSKFITPEIKKKLCGKGMLLNANLIRQDRLTIGRLTGLKGTVLLLCDINPAYVILTSYAVRARETQGSSGSLCGR